MFIENGLHIAQTTESAARRRHVDLLVSIARSAGYATYTLGDVRDVIASSEENLRTFESMVRALLEFWITTDHIRAAGGRQTVIAANLEGLLVEQGFRTEIKFVAPRAAYDDGEHAETFADRAAHCLDAHLGRLALEFQWNSKDVAYYRDAFSFNRLYRDGTIDFAALVTRHTDLSETFKALGVSKKYGASTTHHGKLLPILLENAKQAGSCPTVVFAITDLRIAG